MRDGDLIAKQVDSDNNLVGIVKDVLTRLSILERPESDDPDNTAEVITTAGTTSTLDSAALIPVTNNVPTLTLNSQPSEASGIDTYINAGSPTTNYGTETEINIGKSANINRGLIKFSEMSTIPTNSTVLTVTLKLTVKTGPSNSHDLEVYRLLRNWGEATATYNKYDGVSDWQVAGAGGALDYDSTLLGSVTVPGSAVQGDVITVTFNAAGIAAVQSMIAAPSTDFGFILRMTVENNDLTHYYSSGFATASQRPQLIITYTAPADNTLQTISFGNIQTQLNGVYLKLDASNLTSFGPITSAQLAGVISDETGSGALVFATSPVLVTPTLGVATATSINKVAITAPATGATLTLIDGTVITGPDATATLPGLGLANVFTANQTISNTAPSLVLTDTTASAKSLTIALDANVANFRESAGASGSLLALDLANNTVGLGVAPSATRRLFLSFSMTNPTADLFGLRSNVIPTFNESNSKGASAFSALLQLTVGSTYTNTGALTGADLTFQIMAANAGATTSNNVAAFNPAITMQTNAGGTFTHLAGNYISMSWSGTNTVAVTNLYGERINMTAPSGGGSATNIYGLRVENISGGGTLNYSIFTGTGLVHFGDTVDLASGKNLTLLAGNITTDTTTGTKIGTATTQKLSLWNATPIVQPTTGIAASTFVANTSGIVNDTATWDGYTVGQVVKALRNIGALA